MDVQTEVFLESHARVEILSGATGRRRWPDEVKGRLVAESFLPGVSVREVAERNGLRANRLSTWRGLAKQGKLVVPDVMGADFATIVVENMAPTPSFSGSVALNVGDITVRFETGTAVQNIADFVLALKPTS